MPSQFLAGHSKSPDMPHRDRWCADLRRNIIPAIRPQPQPRPRRYACLSKVTPRHGIVRQIAQHNPLATGLRVALLNNQISLSLYHIHFSHCAEQGASQWEAALGSRIKFLTCRRNVCLISTGSGSFTAVPEHHSRVITCRYQA